MRQAAPVRQTVLFDLFPKNRADGITNSRSKTRRACSCINQVHIDLTRFLKGFITASLVISLKVTRFLSLVSSFKGWQRAGQLLPLPGPGQMPDRRLFTCLASLRSSLITSPTLRMECSRADSRFNINPIRLFGRSGRKPRLATTL